MPLGGTRDFGTHQDGRQADEFCRFCYVNGAFTDPGIELEGMIERCVAIMAQRRMMPEAKARALMSDVLPGLKRWRRTAVSR